MRIMSVIAILALSACNAEDLRNAYNGNPTAKMVVSDTVDEPQNTIDPATCLFNRAHTLGSSALDPNKAYYACYGYQANGLERGIWISLYDDNTVYWGGTPFGSVLPKDGIPSPVTSCDYTFKEGSEIYAKIIDDHSVIDANGYITDIRMSKMINGSYEAPIDYHCTIHN